MRQKLTLITLGVRNFQKALNFYEGLGWQKSGKSMGDYALFSLGGIVLRLHPLEELSTDTGLPYEPDAFVGMTINYNATSEAGVDSVLAKVEELGVTIIKPAQEISWGGYSGYFKDFDGYIFEVAYNPFWEFDANGSLRLRTTKTRITELFGIQYPIIQGGMIWTSGWRLAAAVSDAGGLGLLGTGSICPGILTEHIHKCRAAIDKPFGVNVPIMYPEMDRAIEVILRGGVKVIFTSADNPATYTSLLQKEGIKVAHAVSSSKLALKVQVADVDAVVAEGSETGGHNGREETTTMVLVPAMRHVLDIPLIAAGGIATGNAVLAAVTLGAEGVQVGSQSAATAEASVRPAFKEKVIAADEGDTELTLKELAPVRLLENSFYQQVKDLYNIQQATVADLQALVGNRRAKRGMFEGDMAEGESEIGQVVALIDKMQTAKEVIDEMVAEYEASLARVNTL